MKPCLAVAAAMIAGVVGLAWAGVHEIPLDISPDRVESPLRVSLKQIGTMEPRTIYDVKSSNWTIGCEGLDRDFASRASYRVTGSAVAMAEGVVRRLFANES